MAVSSSLTSMCTKLDWGTKYQTRGLSNIFNGRISNGIFTGRLSFLKYPSLRHIERPDKAEWAKKQPSLTTQKKTLYILVDILAFGFLDFQTYMGVSDLVPADGSMSLDPRGGGQLYRYD